jgi:2-C-methyl-D-erythritol 4-phosphate cytidylyltransferase
MAKIWGIIPAAGIGSRMQSERPKQYLQLNNKPIIEYAIEAMVPVVSGLVVAIAESDSWWKCPENNSLTSCVGGSERVNSVLNAIDKLLELGADHGDWVLVHDAARPLLAKNDLSKLIAHINGGSTQAVILATPLADTIKRSDDGIVVTETVDRSQLWRALTPQAAPLGMLKEALTAALDKGVAVTDESSALEALGKHPVIIPGCPSNLKITLPSDLLIAEALLRETTKR